MKIVLPNVSTEAEVAKEMFMIQFREEKNQGTIWYMQDGISSVNTGVLWPPGNTRYGSSDESLSFSLHCVLFRVYYALHFQFFWYLISYFRI